MNKLTMAQDVSQSAAEISIHIDNEIDVTLAQNQVRDISQQLGFSSKAQWEIFLAVGEAAGNILKHASNGLIIVKKLSAAQKGIEIVAIEGEPVNTAEGDGAIVDDPQTRENNNLRQNASIQAIKKLMDYLFISTSKNGRTILVAGKILSYL